MSQGRGSWRKRARIKKELATFERECWLCLEPLDFTISDWRNPEYIVIDEEIPVSKGGDSLDIANCHLTHNKCNLEKGDRILKRGALAQNAAKKFIDDSDKASRKWLGARRTRKDGRKIGQNPMGVGGMPPG